jgi:hypothetical protein
MASAEPKPDFVREWGREDSNLRRLSRRVYSPFPLAARAHPQSVGKCSDAPRGEMTAMTEYPNAEEELEQEPDDGEPWAKTSSGDADNVTDDE